MEKENTKHMEKCIYRTPLRKVKEGVYEVINLPSSVFVDGILFYGNYSQTFRNGLCEILTLNDTGPVECRQPKKNQDNCPDIAHLRKSVSK